MWRENKGGKCECKETKTSGLAIEYDIAALAGGMYLFTVST